MKKLNVLMKNKKIQIIAATLVAAFVMGVIGFFGIVNFKYQAMSEEFIEYGYEVEDDNNFVSFLQYRRVRDDFAGYKKNIDQMILETEIIIEENELEAEETFTNKKEEAENYFNVVNIFFETTSLKELKNHQEIIDDFKEIDEDLNKKLNTYIEELTNEVEIFFEQEVYFPNEFELFIEEEKLKFETEFESEFADYEVTTIADFFEKLNEEIKEEKAKNDILSGGTSFGGTTSGGGSSSGGSNITTAGTQAELIRYLQNPKNPIIPKRQYLPNDRAFDDSCNVGQLAHQRTAILMEDLFDNPWGGGGIIEGWIVVLMHILK